MVGAMKLREALAFVEKHGVVLQAAKGAAANLAEEIVGGPIRGSWWAHSRSKEIFDVTQAVSNDPNILVCKLIDGKVTYVNRRLWPALVKLASRFPQDRLAKIWDEHTPSGKHVARSIPFPDWVPRDVIKEAKALSIAEAELLLQCGCPASPQ